MKSNILLFVIYVLFFYPNRTIFFHPLSELYLSSIHLIKSLFICTKVTIELTSITNEKLSSL